MTNPPTIEQRAYEMGIDYAKKGANETNCHFSLFGSHESMKAWERGRDSVTQKTTPSHTKNNPTAKLTEKQKAKLDKVIYRSRWPDAMYDEVLKQWYIHDGDGGYLEVEAGVGEVLLALQDSKSSKIPDSMRINLLGEFCHFYGALEGGYFDFRKSYEEQSDELKTFLHKLLC